LSSHFLSVFFRPLSQWWVTFVRLAQKPGDSTVKLWYDPTGQDVAPTIFTVFEPGEIPLKRDTQFVQYKDICSDFAVKVPSAAKLIGKNVPVWKVSIVPDAVDPFTRFALIVSQSQYIGDNYTYYKFFHMLSPQSPVESMNPIRHPDIQEHIERYMGAEEAYYFEKSTPDLVDQMIQNYYKRVDSDNNSQQQNNTETLLFTISQEWLEYQTEQAILMEEHQVGQKGEGTEDDIDQDRNNKPLRPADVLLSWWYNISEADIGMYPHQLRNDLDILSVNDAGNYNNPIPYTKADYATPQLIRDSIRTGRRCGISSETGQRMPLPKMTTGKIFAFGIDWNKHFPSGGIDYETEGIEEDLHIPLLTAEELCTYSSKMRCCLLFTAKTGTLENRIGAFVVAKKEICDRILSSGIVDEDMKTSLTKELVNKRGSILEFDALPDLESMGIDFALDEHDDDPPKEDLQETRPESA
jgi:hypothetical protein